MNYKIEKFKTADSAYEMVVITREDASIESFPVDETNPRYQQFLLETEGE